MTKIISLFGGPGSGKSTSAAYIFAQLKKMGYNAELVREYVKDWAWEKRVPTVYDQFYILGKQIRKESSLLGKVDFIVTDSPVWVCSYYSEKLAPPSIKEGIEACTIGYYRQSDYDGHTHHFVWLLKEHPYHKEGRYQTEEEANQINVEMKDFLDSRGLGYREVGTSFEALDDYIDFLLEV